MRDSAPLNPNLSFGAISLLTFEAVLQVVIICIGGFLAARSGLLNTSGQKVISALNVDLFTPCLVFTKLASSLSVSKLDDILIIPVLFVLSTVTSYGCSRLTSRLLGLNAPELDFVTAMGVFGNSNSLPVSLTLTLAATLPDLLWDQIPDDNSDKVASRGILYLLIFQQLGQILRWSWGFNTLLRKRSQLELSTYAGVVADPELSERTRLLDDGALRIETHPPLEGNAGPDCNNDTDEDHNLIIKTISGTSDNNHSTWVGEKWADFVNSKFVQGFLRFMNPPLYAMAFSIFIASVPSLQQTFFEEDTFVNNTITQAIKQLGSVSIPLILIVMGSNLYPSADVPPPSRNYKKMIFASLLSRMILPSFVLLPLIAACVKFINVSILDDPIFLIVAFVLTISPPAIQLSQITQLNNIYQKEMAGVLFWGYVVLTLPTTIFIVVTSLEVLKWAD